MHFTGFVLPPFHGIPTDCKTGHFASEKKWHFTQRVSLRKSRTGLCELVRGFRHFKRTDTNRKGAKAVKRVSEFCYHH
jgi:hypothetical protein